MQGRSTRQKSGLRNRPRGADLKNKKGYSKRILNSLGRLTRNSSCQTIVTGTSRERIPPRAFVRYHQALLDRFILFVLDGTFFLLFAASLGFTASLRFAAGGLAAIRVAAVRVVVARGVTAASPAATAAGIGIRNQHSSEDRQNDHGRNQLDTRLHLFLLCLEYQLSIPNDSAVSITVLCTLSATVNLFASNYSFISQSFIYPIVQIHDRLA